MQLYGFISLELYFINHK